MSRRLARSLPLLVAAALAATAGGCGLGAGHGSTDVQLTVTRGFGARPVGTASQPRVPGAETVMRMLERWFRITTRYGGGFVQSINGVSGDSSQHDWFYYVNGIEAPQGAASTAVHGGDRIWWDLHDWSQTETVPAVVGSFPEPFLHGVGGKRLPTVIECGAGQSAACDVAQRKLLAAGIPAARQLLGTGSGTDSLGVLIGTWSQLRPTIAGELLARGPGRSGIYARFSGANGTALALLDARGRAVRRLGSGAGLIAATRDGVSDPVWIISGTDAAGVGAAASSLSAPRLRNHFAVAVQGGSSVPVPVP